MDDKTQEAMIIKHLLSGQPLTALEALDRYGCFRLAARIHSVRKVLQVKSEKVRVGKKWIAQYSV